MPMMTVRTLSKAVAALKEAVSAFKSPIVTLIAKERPDPYRVLISCLLSLRTKDATTAQASSRLFRLAETPREMLGLPLEKIEKTIYPVGFYRVKARVLHSVSKDILSRFGGEVPSTLEELLSLKGVGRKTGNLVLTLGFGKPGICVDIHVHRISNRLGFVKTGSPDETEFALRKKLPGRFWIEYNNILVAFGQNVCLPVSPRCSVCPVNRLCQKAGVTRSR